MSIAHNFMSILIHRAGFMSIARYEFYDNIGSMYELCSYYDSGFIMNELCSYISYMTFIMIPTLKTENSERMLKCPKEEAQNCSVVADNGLILPRRVDTTMIGLILLPKRSTVQKLA